MWCVYMDNPSSSGEMKDLGLFAQIMACAIAVHLLSGTLRLLPLQSNKLCKKRFRELGINLSPFSVVSGGSYCSQSYTVILISFRMMEAAISITRSLWLSMSTTLRDSIPWLGIPRFLRCLLFFFYSMGF